MTVNDLCHLWNAIAGVGFAGLYLWQKRSSRPKPKPAPEPLSEFVRSIHYNPPGGSAPAHLAAIADALVCSNQGLTLSIAYLPIGQCYGLTPGIPMTGRACPELYFMEKEWYLVADFGTPEARGHRSGDATDILLNLSDPDSLDKLAFWFHGLGLKFEVPQVANT